MYICIISPVLMSASWYKQSSTLSVRIPVVDDERMRPTHWLGLAFYVPFSALTLAIGWQEGH